MASQFKINNLTPPAGGIPLGPKSRLVYPEATGSSGEGTPCGAVGYEMFETKWSPMPRAAAEWWLDIVGRELSVVVSDLVIYDPHTPGGPAWVDYTSGILHRPDHAGTTWGGAYVNFEIVITRLVRT